MLLHPHDADRPRGTARWLEPRDVRAHHHVRLGSDADAASAARRVTGRAIGVVLSGGNVIGVMHVGTIGDRVFSGAAHFRVAAGRARPAREHAQPEG